MMWSCALLLSLLAAAPAPATEPPQIPLCMIGDSITWAQEGDWWRRHLLDRLPQLAFVGTHTARFGYSHAGEGGNRTNQVLARLEAIPDCPNYSLLIGTNDNNHKNPDNVEPHAEATAGRILQIVDGLLARPGCERVFLSSVLPCHTDNPLRDATNAATNRVLRAALAERDEPRIVWVEYEQPIRAIDGWEPLIVLHPTPDGYAILADILSKAIIDEFDLTPPFAAPVPRPGSGVEVVNLWQGDATGQTVEPVIAGWYTLSFDVAAVDFDGGSIRLHSVEEVDTPLDTRFSVQTTDVGKRVSFPFMTDYEGYGYRRTHLALELTGCRIERILLEKTRPEGRVSVYGTGTFLDTETPPAPGEWVRMPAEG